MQPQHMQADSDVDLAPPDALVAARDLWFSADFEACLALLDRAGVPEGPLRGEALLLRARALYRLRRFAAVVEFLGPLLATFSDVAEVCTARMLHGAALARSGAVERGLELLGQVAAAAEALHVHRAIRAEIAHARALVHWLKREPAEALRFALEAEAAQADIISVRAMQLHGFVELTNHRFPEALAIFRATLNAYRSCRERDADLAEMTSLQIASLELTLRSAHVAATHDVPWGRSFRRAGHPSAGSPVIRMQVLAADAWLFAHDGDRANAFRKMRLAERLAPSEPWHVYALACRAAVANAFGDVDSAREHAAEAAEIAERVDWAATIDEERIGLVFLAEVLAVTAPDRAGPILARYDALRTPLSTEQVLSDDPRRVALESHVRGLVQRIAGRAAEARKGFHTAYQLFRGCGNLWRAALALIELDATPVAGAPRGDFHLETAVLIVREHFPRSFLVRRLGRWLTAYDDPIVASLTPARREVLRYLLDGWVPKEIAQLKGLAEGTVRNQLGDIEATFGVHTIQELLVTCYQRGLGAASWNDRFDPTDATAHVAPPHERFPWLAPVIAGGPRKGHQASGAVKAS